MEAVFWTPELLARFAAVLSDLASGAGTAAVSQGFDASLMEMLWKQNDQRKAIRNMLLAVCLRCMRLITRALVFR